MVRNNNNAVVHGVLLASAMAALCAASLQEFTELRMPQVAVDKVSALCAPSCSFVQAETYLCHALPLDAGREHWITAFEPHSNMETAHHMLLFGCGEPGSDADVWECGEMQGNDEDASARYEHGGVCGAGGRQDIIYAWARDATALTLPDGVGFKVGGDDGRTAYLVLQVHYMHAMAVDSSGMTLVSTDQPMPRRAQTMLMATDGLIRANSVENFETACVIDEEIVMHPFAFRVHAHTRGKVVSGWRVRDGGDDGHMWRLIGKEDPMHPEMFYPVADASMTIERGDVLAARCHMRNDETHDIHVGATGADEMCNFYVMYWVDGDAVLDDNSCPPHYYWATEGGLTNIPEAAASRL